MKNSIILIFFIFSIGTTAIITSTNCVWLGNAGELNKFKEMTAPIKWIHPNTLYNTATDDCCTFVNKSGLDMDCTQGKPQFEWEALPGADFYHVYLNGELYLETAFPRFEMGKAPLDTPPLIDLQFDKTNKLAESVRPYSIYIESQNEFQKIASEKACFQVRDNLCAGVIYSQPPYGGNPIGIFENLNIAITVNDSTSALDMVELSVNGDDVGQIWQSEWMNTQTVTYSSTFSPPPSGWLLSGIPAEIHSVDAFGNDCVDFRSISTTCSEIPTTPVFPKDYTRGVPPFALAWQNPQYNINGVRIEYRRVGNSTFSTIDLPPVTTDYNLTGTELMGPGAYEWKLIFIQGGDCPNLELPLKEFEWEGCSSAIFPNGPCGYFACGTGIQRRVTMQNVPGALFYRIESGLGQLENFSVIGADILPGGQLFFDMLDFQPNFFKACHVRVRACMSVDITRPPSDPFRCSCWSVSQSMGMVCANAGVTTSVCGGMLVGNPNCPCLVGDACGALSPGCGGLQICP